MKTIVAVFLAVIGAPTAVRAQVFDERMTPMWIDSTSGAFVSAGVDDPSLLQWRWPNQDSVLVNGQVFSGMGQIGALCSLTQARFLLGVWDQTVGSGAIVQLEMVSGVLVSASIVPATAALSIRPSSLLLVGTKLFAYDHVTGSVSAGTFAWNQPCVMTEIISGQQLPAVTKSDLHLCAYEAGASLVHDELNPIADHTRYRLFESAPGLWLAEPVQAAPTAQLPNWRMNHPIYVSESQSGYVLEVRGGHGLFGIRRVADGVTVAVCNHTLPAEQNQNFEVPWAQLSYGSSYELVSLENQDVGPSVSWVAMPVWRRRVETASVVSSDLNVRWDYPSNLQDYVAWTLMESWTLMGSGAPAAPHGAFIATMFVGDWQMGVDPTMVLAGIPVLAQSYGDLGFQFLTFDSRSAVSVAYAFNVNNPIFTGAHVAFHCGALLPNGEFVTSDVKGVILQ